MLKVNTMNPFKFCPLPWLGGKRRLVHLYLEWLESRLVRCGYFVEPCAGGLATALTLLSRNRNLEVWVNDAHTPVYAFWKTVQTDPGYLSDRVGRIFANRELWQEYRNSTEDRTLSLNELGWRLYCVHCWSYAQKGQSFNPGNGARAKWRTKALQINNAHLLLKNARITNLDYRDVLAEGEGVTYLDPPYMVATRKNYYRHPFSMYDHLDLCEMLKERESPWLLSYDCCPAVLKLYDWCRITRVVIGRGLGGSDRFFPEVLIQPSKL